MLEFFKNLRRRGESEPPWPIWVVVPPASCLIARYPPETSSPGPAPLPRFTCDEPRTITTPNGWAITNPKWERLQAQWWAELPEGQTWIGSDGLEVTKGTRASEFILTEAGLALEARRRAVAEFPELDKIARGVVLGLERFSAGSAATPAGDSIRSALRAAPGAPAVDSSHPASDPNGGAKPATPGRRDRWCRQLVVQALEGVAAGSIRLAELLRVPSP